MKYILPTTSCQNTGESCEFEVSKVISYIPQTIRWKVSNYKPEEILDIDNTPSQPSFDSNHFT